MKDYTQQIDQLLQAMSLEEKASLCSGLDFWHTQPIERLGIPAVMMTDGPHGMRKEDSTDETIGMKRSIPATCFPPAVTCAGSWDPELVGQMGEHMADEARDQQVITILGPGTNIKRNPRGGRNFEYYSEDPFLAGRLAASYIKGVQSKGIGTSLKHYAVNSQEYLRMTISEVVDERTFREIYLPAFEYAVKESQPAQIMCSYNRINGTYSSENKYLLTDILRDEWGFKGIVVSDWGATNDRVEGVKAGLDLEMPSSGGLKDKEVVEAVKAGKLEEAQLDVIVRRMLQYILRYKDEVTPDFHYDYEKSHRLARRIAGEGAVLLKNEGNILPLAKGQKIALLGALAQDSRYQGAGSSLIVPKHLVHLPEVLDEQGQPYEFAAGYTLKEDGYEPKLIAEAVEVAKRNDKVVLFLGLTNNYESEGLDRSDLSIPKGHTELLKAVVKANPNVVVVLVGGAPIEMDWEKDVKGILNVYLAGEAAGEAYYDLLFGDVNPSGKLAETYPLKLEDFIGNQYFRQGPRTVEHREGLFVGYRYYDTAGKEVRYPFGYGLSYTTFAYSDLKLSKSETNADEGLDVSFVVTNTGDRFGKEVAQLYVRDLESTPFRPDKELKGFEKVALEAGESKTVTLHLDRRSFAYYNVEQKDWIVESGEFEILIGASSRDIKLQDKVTVKGDEVKHTDLREIAPAYYHLKEVDAIPDEQFAAIVPVALSDNAPLKKGEFTANSTISDIRVTTVGKIFAKVGLMAIKSNVKNADMTTLLCIEAGFLEVPVRNFVSMTGGLVAVGTVNGIVTMANGKFCKGLCMVLGSLPHILGELRKGSKAAKAEKKAKKKAAKAA